MGATLGIDVSRLLVLGKWTPATNSLSGC